MKAHHTIRPQAQGSASIETNIFEHSFYFLNAILKIDDSGSPFVHGDAPSNVSVRTSETHLFLHPRDDSRFFRRILRPRLKCTSPRPVETAFSGSAPPGAAPSFRRNRSAEMASQADSRVTFPRVDHIGSPGSRRHAM